MHSTESLMTSNLLQAPILVINSHFRIVIAVVI